MDAKPVARVLFAFLTLAMLCWLGVPLAALAVLGIMLVLFLLMKGPAYNHIDSELARRFPSISGWSPWQRRLLVAAVFVLACLLLKQGIYGLLKMAGMDVQQMMLDSIEAAKG